jgi:hypothetical protein
MRRTLMERSDLPNRSDPEFTDQNHTESAKHEKRQ